MEDEVKKLTLKCPCCNGDIIADINTGEVLYHKKIDVKEDKVSMKELIEEVKGQKDKILNRFEHEKEAFKQRKQVLDEIFKESLKNVDKDNTPPKSPFDRD